MKRVHTLARVHVSATHCNTLQHTATHCNTNICMNRVHTLALVHVSATHCDTLQDTATHCNTLQHKHMHELCPHSCTCSCVMPHTHTQGIATHECQVYCSVSAASCHITSHHMCNTRHATHMNKSWADSRGTPTARGRQCRMSKKKNVTCVTQDTPHT